jgi:GGDEF domain-containing protein
MGSSRLRPAAVVDVRLEPLLGSPEELAKRWLLALLGSRPLRRAGEVSLHRFAREAPELCAGVVRSLGSDVELDRLRTLAAPDSRIDVRRRAAGIAEMLGIDEPSAIVEAVEALRAALWSAIAETFPDLGASAAGALADRLAHACSMLAAGVLRQDALAEPASAGSAPTRDRTADAALEAAPAAGAGVPSGRDRAPRIEMQEPIAKGAEETDLEDPWAIALPPEAERSAWSKDVAPEIERRFDDGAPFAVLLIEVVDTERLREAGNERELDALVAAVQRALREPLGLLERLAAEGVGRWWLVAPGLRAEEGRALAERLASSVSVAVEHHRTPVRIAVGVAVSPEDGSEADELAEHSEQELYAALAAGVSVVAAGAPRVSDLAPER